MVRLAAEHDLGLAVEIPSPRNRDICLTNKAFTYLIAGMPVLLSRTSAQNTLGNELGKAGMLIELAETTKIAALLDTYFGDSRLQQEARGEAWRLGRTRFNWEVEKRAFLDSIEHTFSKDFAYRTTSSISAAPPC